MATAITKTLPFLSHDLKLSPCHSPLQSSLSRSPFSRPFNFLRPINAISASSTPSSSQDSLSQLQVPIAINSRNPASSVVAAAAATSRWSEFARNVSGEWDGYGAEFSINGKPIELPENVVPEAYREWEVKVFDWQTQCPTLALPDEPEPAVLYKLIKLLPTVGCEADAATRFSIDERNIGGIDNRVSAFAYEPSGSYVAVWPRGDDDVANRRLLQLEHCLVDPRNRESRVRIIQSVRLDEGDTNTALEKIEVFSEQWYGPFRNGEQLGGCAIRDSAFASTDAIMGTEVFGVWQQAPAAVAAFQTFQHNLVRELLDEGPGSAKSVIREEGDLILLPKQLWCSLKERDGETCGEVGWVLDTGHAITSRCIFSSNAKLKEIAIARETAKMTYGRD